ncbi:MAG: hypothetical protein Q4G46_16155, partial [Propionibacteriaceae bacterium]|nr:hypothetical protein [Propionibacteriaceae bacterium]
GPMVSEFLCLELAGLLECTPLAAAGKLYSALRLKHRHPTLYRAVQDLDIEVSRAFAAVDRCVVIADDEVADRVTTAWLPKQLGVGHQAAMNRLDKLIVQADPQEAARREVARRRDLEVAIWGHFDGVMNLSGRLETLDARYLDAAVERMAEILKQDHPEVSKGVLRAKALGVLANPALALAMLQRAAQPALVDEPPADQPDHRLCGTITVPLHKLRPKLELAVHIDVNALGEVSPAARIDKAGHMTLQVLRESLVGIDVTVQPVIDLNNVPAEDQYRPSAGLAKALTLAFPTEMFPYSSQATGRFTDFDHTQRFRQSGRGQTRLGNLCPFSRRVHRGKTAGIWDVTQHKVGVLQWTSPLKYVYEVTSQGTRMIDTGHDAWQELAA